MSVRDKIAVFLPCRPLQATIRPFEQALSFLQKKYTLVFFDPAAIGSHEAISDKAFYHLWAKKIEEIIPDYTAFLGFSSGGLILQQCFFLFELLNKPIILFSTPSFANPDLKQKLGQVIALAHDLRVEEALTCFYQLIEYPNARQAVSWDIDNRQAIAKYLVISLQRVLNTDTRPILQQSTCHYLHFIGALSKLVNRENVIDALKSKIIEVPEAGMRVLENNPAYCQHRILSSLVKWQE